MEREVFIIWHKAYIPKYPGGPPDESPEWEFSRHDCYYDLQLAEQQLAERRRYYRDSGYRWVFSLGRALLPLPTAEEEMEAEGVACVPARAATLEERI